MPKDAADTRRGGGAQSEAVGAAIEPLERTFIRQTNDISAMGGEMFRFMAERLEAYAQAMAEFQQCRTLSDVWATQIRFGQRMIQAYSGESAKLADMAVSRSTDTIEELKRAA